MTAPIYTLLLRAHLPGEDLVSREELDRRLARIPGLRRAAADLYRFGEPDAHGVMEIQMRAPATESDRERAEVRVPRPWVLERGTQVFAIVFMMAEWCRWEVHDPQIGERLRKETVLQGLVAMRQRRLEAEGRGGPPGTRAHFADPDREG